MSQAQHDFNNFLAYLSSCGEVGGNAFQEWLKSRGLESQLLHLIERDYPPPQVVPQVTSLSLDDLEYRNEGARIQANLAALKALRLLDSGLPIAESKEIEKSLRGFSGWGGIKVSTLPLDADAFTEEYLKAIKEFKDYQASGKIADIPLSNLFAGMQDQYFTPTRLCDVAWRMTERAWMSSPLSNGIRSPLILEPSAGVGRFLATQPLKSARWVTVEADPIPARILRHLNPKSIVFRAYFESIFRQMHAEPFEADEETARFHVIIGNPPYPERSKREMNLDMSGRTWKHAHAYFVAQCMKLLVPGGVMTMVTPVSQLTGTSSEFIALRKALLIQGHFSGAFFPPSNMFPGANVSHLVHTWTKLAESRPVMDLSDLERQVLNGQLPMTDYGRRNVMGAWVKGRWSSLEVHGTFDPAFVPETIQLPADLENAIMESEPEDLDFDFDKVKDDDALQAEGVTPDLTRALSIAKRSSTFLRLLKSSPEEAEGLRPELLSDVKDFIESIGGMANLQVPKSYRDQVSTLAALIVKDIPAKILMEPVTQGLGLPPTGIGAPATVDWFCYRQGVCTDEDLYKAGFQAEDIDRLTIDPEIYLEIKPQGFWFWTKAYYFQDNLYLRLDAMEAMLATGHLDDGMRARLEAIRLELYEKIQPKTVENIIYSPRSGFIPLKVIADYTAEKLAQKIPHWGQKRLEVDVKAEFRMDRGVYTIWWWYSFPNRKKYTGEGIVEEIPEPFSRKPKLLWNGSQEEPRYYQEHMSPSGKSAQETWLWVVNLMGYLNRLEMVEDPQEEFDSAKARGRGRTLAERVEADDALENDFRSWVQNNQEARRAVEDGYNRAYRSRGLLAKDDSPLKIPRMTKHKKLRPHQAASTRWCRARRGGLIGHEVGLGKTPLGLAVAAQWRSEGRAQRPIVLVPPSVLVNWYHEARNWLDADYVVETVGWTWDPIKRKGHMDSDQERKAKWERYMRGEIELLLVPYQWFINDIGMDPDHQLELILEILFMQKKGKLSEDVKKKWLRKVDLIRAKIKRHQLEHDYAQALRYTTRLAAGLEYDKDYPPEELVEIEKKKEARRSRGKPPFGYETDWRGAPLWSTEILPQKYSEYADHQKRQSAAALAEGNTAIAKLEAEVAALMQKIEKGQEAEQIKDEPEEGEVDDKEEKVMTDRLVDQIREDAENHRESTLRPIGNDGLPSAPMVRWEDLGCDLLMVDEAHNFKNLFTIDGQYGKPIKYMGSSRSLAVKRSWDLFLKCHWLLKTNDNQGVFLLTGTPAKNSPLDIFNLLSLVSRTIWSEFKINNPDEFVEHFILSEPGVFFSQAGEIQEAMLALRFDKAPEDLRLLLSSYADIVFLESTPELAQLVPSWTRIPIEVEMDEGTRGAYRAAKEAIRKEMEALEESEDYGAAKAGKSKLILRSIDIMDKIATEPALLSEDIEKTEAAMEKLEGIRKGGKGKIKKTKEELDKDITRMDERLTLLNSIGPDRFSVLYSKKGVYPPKYEALARKVKTMPKGCGHLIFVRYVRAIPGIIRALTEVAGIPKDRIAKIIGGKPGERQEIAQNFNGVSAQDSLTGEEIKAKYDVIIGTDGVMSEGLNLQRRTCAIHHLTLAWESATLSQRNGRGVRQGNKNDNVMIFYYMSKGVKIDAYRAQITSGKANWMKTLLTSGSQEAANPLVAEEENLLTQIHGFMVDEDDPPEVIEAAKKKIQEAIESLAARNRDRLAKRNERAFNSMMGLYNSARWHASRNQLPLAEIRMAEADQIMETLRTSKGVPTGLKADLPRVKTKNAIWNGADFWAIDGDRIVLLTKDFVKSIKDAKLDLETEARDYIVHNPHEMMEVLETRVWGNPVVRHYGSLQTQGLPGMPEDWIRYDPEIWDPTMDYQKILENATLDEALHIGLRATRERYLPLVWDVNIDREIIKRAYALIEARKNNRRDWAQKYGFSRLSYDKILPLRKEGKFLLFEFGSLQHYTVDEAMVRIGEELRTWTPLDPYSAGDFEVLWRALKADRVQYVSFDPVQSVVNIRYAMPSMETLRDATSGWFHLDARSQGFYAAYSKKIEGLEKDQGKMPIIRDTALPRDATTAQMEPFLKAFAF